MELKDFIKMALTEICDGIAEARSNIESKYKGNCIIAPANIDGRKAYTETKDIMFDLAIQLEEENSKDANGKGKIGVSCLSLSVGGNVEKKTSEKKINRISFSVPFLPQGLRSSKGNS